MWRSPPECALPAASALPWGAGQRARSHHSVWCAVVVSVSYRLNLASKYDKYVLDTVLKEVLQCPGAAVIGQAGTYQATPRSRSVPIGVRGRGAQGCGW